VEEIAGILMMSVKNVFNMFLEKNSDQKTQLLVPSAAAKNVAQQVLKNVVTPQTDLNVMILNVVNVNKNYG
jgi:hypothetical protein